MSWINNKIKKIEEWLKLNEHQASLPTMEIEDALHKKEVTHQKEILSLLHKFKKQSKAQLNYEDVCSPTETNYPQCL